MRAFSLLLVLGALSSGSCLVHAHELPSPCRDNQALVDRDRYRDLPDESLELLALRVSVGLHADHAVYERLVRDVGSIKSTHPDLREVLYSPKVANRLMIQFTPEAFKAIEEGRYREWNCLNSFLGATPSRQLGNQTLVLALGGRYQMSDVLNWYQKLPGVVHSEVDSQFGGANNIYLSRKGDRWAYIFDIGGGDCPSGCTEHALYYFETSASGRLLRNQVYDTHKSKDAPDWALRSFGKYE